MTDSTQNSQEDSEERNMDPIKKLKKKLREVNQRISQMSDNGDYFESKMVQDLNQINEQLNKQKADMQRLRTLITVDFNKEIVNVKSQQKLVCDELKRINFLLQKSIEVQKTLFQDQLIMQMLQEQDIIDRKQIGLFGQKKNQQILGSNMFAMSNNILNVKSSLSPKQKNSKKYWELRNKNIKYSQIVNKQSNAFPLRETIQNGESIQPTYQIKNDSPEIDNNLKDQSLFMNKFHSPNQQNTLFIDRNCAACHNQGSSQQILSQIKLACLSYVNSPIQYGPFMNVDSKQNGLDKKSLITSANANENNFQDQLNKYLDFKVSDLIQMKECLLLNSQNLISEINIIQKKFQSQIETTDLSYKLEKQKEDLLIFLNRKNLIKPKAQILLDPNLHYEVIKHNLDSQSKINKKAILKNEQKTRTKQVQEVQIPDVEQIDSDLDDQNDQTNKILSENENRESTINVNNISEQRDQILSMNLLNQQVSKDLQDYELFLEVQKAQEQIQRKPKFDVQILNDFIDFKQSKKKQNSVNDFLNQKIQFQQLLMNLRSEEERIKQMKQFRNKINYQRQNTDLLSQQKNSNQHIFDAWGQEEAKSQNNEEEQLPYDQVIQDQKMNNLKSSFQFKNNKSTVFQANSKMKQQFINKSMLQNNNLNVISHLNINNPSLIFQNLRSSQNFNKLRVCAEDEIAFEKMINYNENLKQQLNKKSQVQIGQKFKIDEQAGTLSPPSILNLSHQITKKITVEEMIQMNKAAQDMILTQNNKLGFSNRKIENIQEMRKKIINRKQYSNTNQLSISDYRQKKILDSGQLSFDQQKLSIEAVGIKQQPRIKLYDSGKQSTINTAQNFLYSQNDTSYDANQFFNS